MWAGVGTRLSLFFYQNLKFMGIMFIILNNTAPITQEVPPLS